MSNMFAVHTSPRKGIAKAAQQRICLLDSTRATNLGIVLSRLRMSTDAICQCVSTLDFTTEFTSLLSLDDIELAGMLVPSTQEIDKLQAHKDKADQLRDVEQSLMPLCTLSMARLRVMKVALSFHETHGGGMKSCRMIQQASEEARCSEQFREVLAVVLQMGNVINEGEGVVKAFAIESLHMLTSFKRGAVSALHCLCITLLQEFGENFLQKLLESLEHVHSASRQRKANLEDDLRGFENEFRFVEEWAQTLSQEAEEKQRVDALVAELAARQEELQQAKEEAMRLSNEAQMYFSVAQASIAKLPPFEQFFGHIDSFLRQFHAAWCEITSGRGRWKELARLGSGDLESASAAEATTTPKNASPMSKAPGVVKRAVTPGPGWCTGKARGQPKGPRAVGAGAKTAAAAKCKESLDAMMTSQVSVPAPHDDFWNSLRQDVTESIRQGGSRVAAARAENSELRLHRIASASGVKGVQNANLCEFHILDDDSSDSDQEDSGRIWRVSSEPSIFVGLEASEESEESL